MALWESRGNSVVDYAMHAVKMIVITVQTAKT